MYIYVLLCFIQSYFVEHYNTVVLVSAPSSARLPFSKGTCHVSREEKPARRVQGDQGDRGEGSRCKTERGADRSRLDAAKNIS